MRAIAALVIGILLAHQATAGDWPHWRGEQRNGHVEEASGIKPDGWPGPPVWTARAGEGSTSPLVIGQQVYVSGWSDRHDSLKCLDLATGKLQWAARFSSPRHARFATGDEGLYAGPTATPEYDASQRRLYMLSSDGWLRSLDVQDRGQELWSLNLYDRFEVQQRPKVLRSGLRDYGYTSSPLVYGDWLIVEVGAEQGLVMAFDKHTGKHLWSSEPAGPAGHTGAVVSLMVDGIPCPEEPGRVAIGRGAGTNRRRVPVGNRVGQQYSHADRKRQQTPRLFATDAWPHIVLARGRILCKDRAGNLKCFAVP